MNLYVEYIFIPVAVVFFSLHISHLRPKTFVTSFESKKNNKIILHAFMTMHILFYFLLIFFVVLYIFHALAYVKPVATYCVGFFWQSNRSKKYHNSWENVCPCGCISCVRVLAAATTTTREKKWAENQGNQFVLNNVRGVSLKGNFIVEFSMHFMRAFRPSVVSSLNDS